MLTHSLHCGRRDGVLEGGADAEDADAMPSYEEHNIIKSVMDM